MTDMQMKLSLETAAGYGRRIVRNMRSGPGRAG